MDKKNDNLVKIVDKDFEEFLSIIKELRINNKEKFCEAKGLIKGVFISDININRFN